MTNLEDKSLGKDCSQFVLCHCNLYVFGHGLIIIPWTSCGHSHGPVTRWCSSLLLPHESGVSHDFKGEPEVWRYFCIPLAHEDKNSHLSRGEDKTCLNCENSRSGVISLCSASFPPGCHAIPSPSHRHSPSFPPSQNWKISDIWIIYFDISNNTNLLFFWVLHIKALHSFEIIEKVLSGREE